VGPLVRKGAPRRRRLTPCPGCGRETVTVAGRCAHCGHYKEPWAFAPVEQRVGSGYAGGSELGSDWLGFSTVGFCPLVLAFVFLEFGLLAAAALAVLLLGAAVVWRLDAY
jgi:hypothetical protein